MKKIISTSIFILILLIFVQVNTDKSANADWWQRPDVLPTQPSTPRNLVTPTEPVQPTSPPPSVAPTIQPTTSITQPTVTPRIGGEPTVIPTQPSSGGGGSGSSSGNPCDPGKPFTGPYCGWSPSTNNNGSGGTSSQTRIGGPEVLGLSNTSSSDVAVSDIIFLTGVLCLLLYAKSKLVVNNKSH